MSVVQSRLVIRLFATFVWFTVLAGQFWRNLGGWWGFGAIAVIVVVGSIIGLSTQRTNARNRAAAVPAHAGVAAPSTAATSANTNTTAAPDDTPTDRDIARGHTYRAALAPPLNWRKFPKTVTAFLLLATLSIAWSYYPGASALGITLQLITTLAALFLAVALTWPELLRTLAGALRWVLALSLGFELFVAVVMRNPVLPFFVDYGTDDVPSAFYWSRGLLLEGGPIEGIVANRNLLGFIALTAVIVFIVQLKAHTVKRNAGLVWLALAVGMLLLTRSATVTVSLVAVVAALLFALWARTVHDQHRRPLYVVAAASVLAVGAALALFSSQLFGLLGRSDDLTGRFDIWASVTQLALERPVFGWGWVSYWVPWVEPFNDLAVRKGVTYLQAHNAWLDVWLQLGVIGVILFAALVFSTLWRAWFLAVDRPRLGIQDTEPFAVSALLPLLLLAALIAQSIAESRLLIESGWVILIMLAVVTKRQQHAPRPMP
ncbi:O-antigen ligase domain-containing protein [Cryobacterium glaciale]|uniref:O-antigen ligase domain-containing protein n=1 Tax=Cryobacterium glaciale TaxID=1259145 RepID=A0A4R8V073_9MICO|nr:O-antigen ligase family protein [Cryobacterium glaciale]TFB74182.1 O-antigen ligase domain-containing protein [Cryobacterium glaciale]